MARHLAYGALETVTVRAGLLFATVFQNPLGHSAFSQGIHVRAAHAAQISPALNLVKQDAGAVFAYTVEHLDNVLQVAHVECGQRQLDVAEVAVASVESLATCCAGSLLAGYTHARVHGPVGRKGARIVGGGLEIVDIAVGYFEDGLIDNVLVGAGECYYEFFWCFVAAYVPRPRCLLYAKLDVLYARGDAVDDLLLGRGARRLHGGGWC